ncbi:hypothetical protein [Streptomyces sp. NPDC002851]
MLTRLDSPYCEVWLDDTTIHRVKPHLLILENAAVANAARKAGVTLVDKTGPRPWPYLPQWQWLDWTLAEHLDHLNDGIEPTGNEPVQGSLFTT